MGGRPLDFPAERCRVAASRDSPCRARSRGPRQLSRLMHALERLLVTLATLQVRRPRWGVVLAVCPPVPSAWLALQLEVRTGFGELLPDSSPSVVEHRKVSKRLASQSTLAVTAEGKDTAVLKRFLVEI